MIYINIETPEPIISASGWLFKKKSITMHGNMNVQFVNAKQAKEIYQYRNTRADN